MLFGMFNMKLSLVALLIHVLFDYRFMVIAGPSENAEKKHAMVWPDAPIRYRLTGTEGSHMKRVRNALNYVKTNTCLNLIKELTLSKGHQLAITAGEGCQRDVMFGFKNRSSGGMPDYEVSTYVQYLDIGGKGCDENGRNNSGNALKQLVKSLGLIVNPVVVDEESARLTDKDLKHLNYIYCCGDERTFNFAHNRDCFRTKKVYPMLRKAMESWTPEKKFTGAEWMGIRINLSLVNDDFNYYDINGDDKIDISEFEHMYGVQSMTKILKDNYDFVSNRTTNISSACYNPKTKTSSYYVIDSNHNGKVDSDEFKNFVAGKNGKFIRRNGRDYVRENKLFKFSDSNDDNFLSNEEELDLFCVMESLSQVLAGLYDDKDEFRDEMYLMNAKEGLQDFVVRYKLF